MRDAHHRAVIYTAAEVAPALGLPPLPDPDELAYYAVQADSLGDLVIDDEATSVVFGLVSSPTSLQHFCTPDGRGYSFAADRYKPAVANIAKLSEGRVRFTAHLSGGAWPDAPAETIITGNRAWHHQDFPSAAALTGFYAGEARQLPAVARKRIVALGYAAHMLADLCIPQHVLGTIGLEHQAHEREAERLWLAWRDCSRPTWWLRRQGALLPAVRRHLAALAVAGTPYDLALAVAAQTAATCYPDRDLPAPPPTTKRAVAQTTLAIAATLRLLTICQ